METTTDTAVVNPNPKTDWKYGDVCCYHDPDTDAIPHQMVAEVIHPGITKTHGVKTVVLENGLVIDVDRLFEGKEDAVKVLLARKKSLVDSMASGIKDLDALVRFPLEHNICAKSKDCDWVAYHAYLQASRTIMSVI